MSTHIDFYRTLLGPKSSLLTMSGLSSLSDDLQSTQVNLPIILRVCFRCEHGSLHDEEHGMVTQFSGRLGALRILSSKCDL